MRTGGFLEVFFRAWRLLMGRIPKCLKSPPTLFREILECFALHGERQDTVEGIAEWWLLQNRIEWAVAEVKAALNELVSQRLVLERLGADGRAYYRLNRRRLKQVRALLQSPKTGAKDRLATG